MLGFEKACEWEDAHLVAEPADRYPGDNNGSVGDFRVKRWSISHLWSWEIRQINIKHLDNVTMNNVVRSLSTTDQSQMWR